MAGYSGSCHCGAIAFEVNMDIIELLRCDCSICKKKNALMANVHEDDFKLLKGDNNLAEYRWNTMVARHYFCKTCGIYPFHKKRALPDHYSVNIFCLDDFNHSNIPIRQADGKSMSMQLKSQDGS